MEPLRTARGRPHGDRVTLGKAASNDVALSEDPTVSHLHAALERFAAGWCVTDLGSTNGTFVNSERVWSTRQSVTVTRSGSAKRRDGRWLATTTALDRVRLWDLERAEPVGRDLVGGAVPRGFGDAFSETDRFGRRSALSPDGPSTERHRRS